MYPTYDPALYAVLTVTEIAQRWNMHYESVRRALDEGRLNGRKSGGQWIVTYSSAKRLWGEPKR